MCDFGWQIVRMLWEDACWGFNRFHSPIKGIITMRLWLKEPWFSYQNNLITGESATWRSAMASFSSKTNAWCAWSSGKGGLLALVFVADGFDELSLKPSCYGYGEFPSWDVTTRVKPTDELSVPSSSISVSARNRNPYGSTGCHTCLSAWNSTSWGRHMQYSSLISVIIWNKNLWKHYYVTEPYIIDSMWIKLSLYRVDIRNET